MGNLTLSDDIVNTAHELSDQFPVFPVSKRKTPAISKATVDELWGDGLYGLHMASQEYDKIEQMFSRPGVTGIGMPTGKASSCTVIDVDCGTGKKSRAEATLWLDRNRDKLRSASVVRTMSGGLHYYCRFNPDIPSAGNVWGLGVDCRNNGGYVVVPPFMGYEWKRQMDPDDWPDAPPPLERAGSWKPKASDDVSGDTPSEIKDLIEVMNASRGNDDGWHTAAVRLTAYLVGIGWDDAAILRMAVQWTRDGFTHRETFEDLCVMVGGARNKWKRDMGEIKMDSEQFRADRLVDIWDRCQPATKRAFIDVVAESDRTRHE